MALTRPDIIAKVLAGLLALHVREAGGRRTQQFQCIGLVRVEQRDADALADVGLEVGCGGELLQHMLESWSLFLGVLQDYRRVVRM